MTVRYLQGWDLTGHSPIRTKDLVASEIEVSSSRKCYISILYKLGALFCVCDKDSLTHDL